MQQGWDEDGHNGNGDSDDDEKVFEEKCVGWWESKSE